MIGRVFLWSLAFRLKAYSIRLK